MNLDLKLKRMILKPTKNLSLDECKEVFRTQIDIFGKEVDRVLKIQEETVEFLL